MNTIFNRTSKTSGVEFAVKWLTQIIDGCGMYPVLFAMVVAIAASAAFMTPVSSPMNTMVVGLGGYKFADFIKIGVPFTLIVMLVSVFIVPILFPF